MRRSQFPCRESAFSVLRDESPGPGVYTPAYRSSSPEHAAQDGGELLRSAHSMEQHVAVGKPATTQGSTRKIQPALSAAHMRPAARAALVNGRFAWRRKPRTVHFADPVSTVFGAATPAVHDVNDYMLREPYFRSLQAEYGPFDADLAADVDGKNANLACRFLLTC